VLVNTCLITNDIVTMTAFYEHVLKLKPHKAGDSSVEFRTGRGVLALFTAAA